MLLDDAVVLIAIIGAVTVSVLSGKIDRAGGVLGGIITYALFLGIGWLGIFLIGSFFVLGTLASRWKQQQKSEWGIAEAHGGQRGWRNVVANAGLAGAIALICWRNPAFVDTGRLLISACFAAALSDTWSSELGNVYGTKFYHVLSGKKDQRGRDGVISLEGSVAGIFGSGIMALLYGLFENFSSGVAIILVAGVIGNLMDSVLGAMLERRGILGNHTVNFFNTLTAAAIAYFLVKSCSMSNW